MFSKDKMPSLKRIKSDFGITSKKKAVKDFNLDDNITTKDFNKFLQHSWNRANADTSKAQIKLKTSAITKLATYRRIAKDLARARKSNMMRRTTNIFKKRGTRNADFGSLSLEELVEVLGQMKSIKGRVVMNVGGRHITLNPSSLKQLIDYAENYFLEESYVYGSDYEGDIIYDLIQNEVNFSLHRPKWLGKGSNDGLFFKYYHNTDLDLTPYGIYTEQPKEYKENCFIQALILAGVDKTLISRIRSMIVPTNPQQASFKYVPTLWIEKICEEIKLCIEIKKPEVVIDGMRKNKDPLKKGAQYKKNGIIKMGLIDNHYFFNEEFKGITQYALKNYHKIPMLDKDVYNKEGCKDATRTTTTFKIVEHFFKNKDEFLSDIPFEDLIATNYYKETDLITTLEYNDMLDVKLTDYWSPKIKEKTPINIFFDFETITTNRHIPYMVAMDYDNKVFYGEDCGLKMLRYLFYNIPTGTPIKMIAHNLGYDFRFIQQHLNLGSLIERGHNVMRSEARFYGSKGLYLDILLQDSYCIIAKPLKAFPDMFGLEMEKELLAYTLYTKENCEKKRLTLKEIRPHTDIQVRQNMIGKVITDSDYDKYFNQYVDKAKSWNCYYENYSVGYEPVIDIIKFSEIYCKRDVEVLKAGWEAFKETMATINCDLEQYMSAAQIAHDYMVNQNVFQDVYKLSSTPREFIMKAMVGGRTMCCENKKIRKKIKMADYDATSLYPSAMEELGGYLCGIPKILLDEQKSFDFLQQQDGYFVKIKINSLPIKRKFPLQSYINEKSVRCWTNEIPDDKFTYVGKIGLEDLIEFQGLKDFVILDGYYFDEGRNMELKPVIQGIFSKRLEAKEVKNPIQEVYKLIMNSSYGKTLLKPFGEQVVFKHQGNLEAFVDKNYNRIKYYCELAGSDEFKKYKVKLEEPIKAHFNHCHCGVEVLEMSKRIMNRVMCLAEDKKLDMYYQDTDSIHMKYDDVPKLEKAYGKKYPGKTLQGKQMGQFHTDFDSAIIRGNCYTNKETGQVIEKNFDNEVEWKAWCKDNKKEWEKTPIIWSSESIFLGKKCYVDYLCGKDYNGKLVRDFHIRMKGVPSLSIKDKSIKEERDMLDIYGSLYEGYVESFDLACGGVKPAFEFHQDLTISSIRRPYFRKVQFKSAEDTGDELN